MAGDEQAENRPIPLSSKWLETLLYLGIFGWLAVLLNETLTWTNAQDWWGPMGVIIVSFILVTVKLVDVQTDGWVTGLAQQPEADVPDDDVDEERQKLTQSMEDARKSEDDASVAVQDWRALVLSAWIVLYPLLVFYVGFLYATPPYLLGLLYYLTRDVVRTVITAAIVLVFLYLLFVEVLNVRLHDGMLNLIVTCFPVA